jgi:hypothetical protein
LLYIYKKKTTLQYYDDVEINRENFAQSDRTGPPWMAVIYGGWN